MMELTKNEQKALIVIIFFLLAGAGVRIYGNFRERAICNTCK
jgi:hypothetical protein